MNHSVVKVYQQLNILYVTAGMIFIPGVKIWENLHHKPIKSYKGISLVIKSEYTFML